MRIIKKIEILIHAVSLSDAALKEKAYDAIYDCLGS